MLICPFCKIHEHEIVFDYKNQNKNNFRVATLTKHVNNQTNCGIDLKKSEKNMELSHIYSAVQLIQNSALSTIFWRQCEIRNMEYSREDNISEDTVVLWKK